MYVSELQVDAFLWLLLFVAKIQHPINASKGQRTFGSNVQRWKMYHGANTFQKISSKFET